MSKKETSDGTQPQQKSGRLASPEGGQVEVENDEASTGCEEAVNAQEGGADEGGPVVSVTLSAECGRFGYDVTLPAADRLLWHPIDDAAKSGDKVFLEGDPNMEEWRWYRTRQFRKGSWQSVGWWQRDFGPKGPPNFVPTGYRRVSEFQ